jgi:hypothetical protein
VTGAQRRHHPAVDHHNRAQFEALHGRHKTVSFVVGSSVHLDLGGETIPYVAGWGENGALEAVTEFAATIDTMARPISHADRMTCLGSRRFTVVTLGLASCVPAME